MGGAEHVTRRAVRNSRFRAKTAISPAASRWRRLTKNRAAPAFRQRLGRGSPKREGDRQLQVGLPWRPLHGPRSRGRPAPGLTPSPALTRRKFLVTWWLGNWQNPQQGGPDS